MYLHCAEPTNIRQFDSEFCCKSRTFRERNTLEYVHFGGCYFQNREKLEDLKDLVTSIKMMNNFSSSRCVFDLPALTIWSVDIISSTFPNISNQF